jgi:SAM-dependent methyltransferase
LNLSTRRIGAEKAVIEPSRLRRLGYRTIGEIHIPGRIRLHHVLRGVRSLKLPETDVRMLDAGTGRGDLALYFSRLYPGWRVTGIDVEDDRVARCKEAAELLRLDNVNFRRMDLLQLDASEQYDLITCTDVLEHIEDDRLALANLAHALRPGGHLVLSFPSVPQRRHLRLVARRERRINFSPADIGHVREGYSVDGIVGLLKAVGLVPLQKRWTYGPFGNLAHDIFFVIGDSDPNPLVYAAALPFLLFLSFLENHTSTHRGSGLLVIAAQQHGERG